MTLTPIKYAETFRGLQQQLVTSDKMRAFYKSCFWISMTRESFPISDVCQVSRHSANNNSYEEIRVLKQLSLNNSPQLIINSVLELFVSLRLFTESILTETERDGGEVTLTMMAMMIVISDDVTGECDVVTGTRDRKIATNSSFNFLISNDYI